MPKGKHLAYILIIVTIAIWGIATPVIKATVSYVPPLTFLWIRFLISTLICLPFAVWYYKHYHLNKFRIKTILISSLIGFVFGLSFIFVGIEMSSAIEASLISSISPILVSVMSYFILKELITKKQIEGTLIAFVGAIILILSPIFEGKSIFNGGRVILIGNIIFIIGVFFDALYSIYLKKYITKDKIITPFMHIVFAFLFAAIVFTPIAIIEQYYLYDKSLEKIPLNSKICTASNFDVGIYDIDYECVDKGCRYISNGNPSGEYDCLNLPDNLSFTYVFLNNLFNYLKPPSLYGIIYMAILSGILAYTLFSKGLRYIQASQASLFYYLQPLFGVPIAILFLRESVSCVFIVGSIIITAGIILAERK
jgi:drug/metabolite transporter (DMT)-like permease